MLRSGGLATELNRLGLVDGLTPVKVSPAALTQVRRAYRASSDVLHVEPNVRITFFGTVPDDCNLPRQRGLRNENQEVEGLPGLYNMDIDALLGKTLTHRRMASGAV